MLTVVDDTKLRATYAMGNTLARLIDQIPADTWRRRNDCSPTPLPIVVDVGVRFGALAERRRKGRHEFTVTELGRRWRKEWALR